VTGGRSHRYAWRTLCLTGLASSVVILGGKPRRFLHPSRGGRVHTGSFVVGGGLMGGRCSELDDVGYDVWRGV